jgi:DNA-binding transcriptional MerR regulator
LDKLNVKRLDPSFFRHILCRKKDGTLNINELALRSGAVERQIRYLIAEGFMPAPRGSRTRPDYGEDHVDAIRRYMALRKLGFPPAAVRLLGESGEAIALPVVDGISLLVEPRLVGGTLDVAAILDRLDAILKQLQKDPSP